MRTLIAVGALWAGSAGADDAPRFELVRGNRTQGAVELPDSIRLETSFGSATALRSKLEELTARDATVEVVAGDGVRLTGVVDWKSAPILKGGQPLALQPGDAVQAVRPAALAAGAFTVGRAANRLRYELRAPKSFDPKRKWPALAVFHGSNMRSRNYTDTIVAAWPALAEKHILIGIDGEQRRVGADGQAVCNYTYVNFVGRSKFKGFPGTDREGPALVAELLRELQARLPIERTIAVGHSQGGDLVYSLAMNYPELFAGAVPVSGGMIVQAAPEAYDNQELIALQKQVPIAIVHGKNDRNVGFGMATAALKAFEGAQYNVKLFAHDTAAHAFGLLPVEQAIGWIEAERTQPAAKQ